MEIPSYQIPTEDMDLWRAGKLESGSLNNTVSHVLPLRKVSWRNRSYGRYIVVACASPLCTEEALVYVKHNGSYVTKHLSGWQMVSIDLPRGMFPARLLCPHHANRQHSVIGP